MLENGAVYTAARCRKPRRVRRRFVVHVAPGYSISSGRGPAGGGKSRSSPRSSSAVISFSTASMSAPNSALRCGLALTQAFSALCSAVLRAETAPLVALSQWL